MRLRRHCFIIKQVNFHIKLSSDATSFDTIMPVGFGLFNYSILVRLRFFDVYRIVSLTGDILQHLNVIWVS